MCRFQTYQLVNMINGSRILRLILIIIDYNLNLDIILVSNFKHYYMALTSEYLVEMMPVKGQMITYDQRD